jgi:hypothetical protein
MLFWRLSCGFIIITCFDISLCLNYSNKLKAILLSNKHLAPHNKACFDSAKFQAEEWSDDDPREDFMAHTDCSNTANNPTEQTEFDTHPISKSNLLESSDESEPVLHNVSGVTDLNKNKSLAWKILIVTYHMKVVKKNKQQNGETPKGKTMNSPHFTTLPNSFLKHSIAVIFVQRCFVS